MLFQLFNMALMRNRENANSKCEQMVNYSFSDKVFLISRCIAGMLQTHTGTVKHFRNCGLLVQTHADNDMGWALQNKLSYFVCVGIPTYSILGNDRINRSTRSNAMLDCRAKD